MTVLQKPAAITGSDSGLTSQWFSALVTFRSRLWHCSSSESCRAIHRLASIWAELSDALNSLLRCWSAWLCSDCCSCLSVRLRSAREGEGEGGKYVGRMRRKSHFQPVSHVCTRVIPIQVRLELQVLLLQQAILLDLLVQLLLLLAATPLLVLPFLLLLRQDKIPAGTTPALSCYYPVISCFT